MTLVVPGQTVRYRAYDLRTMTYKADLPLTGVSFGQRLNNAGPFKGSLPLSDPRVRRLAPVYATEPSKTALFVDLNGTLVWGGIIWTRRFSRSTRSFELGGLELWSYFAHRTQARDYSTQWGTTKADPMVIAQTIITDALDTELFPATALAEMPVVLEYQSATDPANFITTTYPIAQLQFIDRIVSTLAAQGYGVGFDYGIDVAYDMGGNPTATMTLSYPRRGHIFAPEGDNAVIDVAPGYDYTYPEDGSKQANRVHLTSNLGNATPQTVVEDPSSWADGYPLLEEVANFPQVNTTDVLDSLAAGELATHTRPPISPVVDVNPFGAFALGKFKCGDDVRFIVPDQVDVGDVADERFPGGQEGRF